MRSYGDILGDTDISFVSSGRPSVDRMPLPLASDAVPEERRSTNNRLSTSSDNDFLYDTSHRRSSVDTPLSSPPPPSSSNISFDDMTNVNWSNTQSQSMVRGTFLYLSSFASCLDLISLDKYDFSNGRHVHFTSTINFDKLF